MNGTSIKFQVLLFSPLTQADRRQFQHTSHEKARWTLERWLESFCACVVTASQANWQRELATEKKSVEKLILRRLAAGCKPKERSKEEEWRREASDWTQGTQESPKRDDWLAHQVVYSKIDYVVKGATGENEVLIRSWNSEGNDKSFRDEALVTDKIINYWGAVEWQGTGDQVKE